MVTGRRVKRRTRSHSTPRVRVGLNRSSHADRFVLSLASVWVRARPTSLAGVSTLHASDERGHCASRPNGSSDIASRLRLVSHAQLAPTVDDRRRTTSGMQHASITRGGDDTDADTDSSSICRLPSLPGRVTSRHRDDRRHRTLSSTRVDPGAARHREAAGRRPLLDDDDDGRRRSESTVHAEIAKKCDDHRQRRRRESIQAQHADQCGGGAILLQHQLGRDAAAGERRPGCSRHRCPRGLPSGHGASARRRT